jgi:PGF-CTERM protein
MFGDRHPPSDLVALGLAVLVVTSVSVAAAGTAAGPTLSASPATTTVDEETTVNVTVSEVPDGLSGFNVTLEIADPDVGSVVDASVNDDMGLKETALADDGASVRLKAVDIDDVVQSGDGPVTLATVTVRGDATGSSALTIDVDQVDDDDGNRIDPALGDASLTVEDGSSDPPTTTTEQPTATQTSTPTTTEQPTTTQTSTQTTSEQPTTTQTPTSTTEQPTTTQTPTSTTEQPTTTQTPTSTKTEQPTTTEQPTATQTTVETTTEDESTPGFGVALVVVALLSTAAIGARRR